MSLSNRFCDDIDVQVTSSNVIGGSDSSLKSGPSFYIFLKNGDEKYKLVSAQMQKHTQKKNCALEMLMTLQCSKVLWFETNGIVFTTECHLTF